MSPRSGVSQVEFLVVLLIFFIAMAISWPYLLRSGTSAGEPEAVAMLRSIHAAQQEMYGASRLYGSMRKLSNSKLVAQSQDTFKVKGYDIEHSTNGSGRTWCATAVPEEGKPGRTLGIDDSGTVWHGVSRMACYMGSLNTTGAVVLK